MNSQVPPNSPAFVEQTPPDFSQMGGAGSGEDQQQMTIGIPLAGQDATPDVLTQMILQQQQMQQMQQAMQQQQQQQPDESFPLMGEARGYPMVQDVYVPDFSAIPPPEILQV